jgi:hypothetical protein
MGSRFALKSKNLFPRLSLFLQPAEQQAAGKTQYETDHLADIQKT